ncbi:MAG: hypothetical protein HN636_02045 [Cryomorphaceae bacterium]|nr:hypothetical protein [Cryomorphaceae bacterium]
MEINRSSEAKQILGNKIFIEAIESLKKLYSEALLEKTGAKESDTREKLWIAYNVVGKVEQHLQTVIETGELATKQLEDFRKQQNNTKF